MNKTICALALSALLIPSISSAQGLTYNQASSIIVLLEAFNVDQATINNVWGFIAPEDTPLSPPTIATTQDQSGSLDTNQADVSDLISTLNSAITQFQNLDSSAQAFNARVSSDSKTISPVYPGFSGFANQFLSTNNSLIVEISSYIGVLQSEKTQASSGIDRPYWMNTGIPDIVSTQAQYTQQALSIQQLYAQGLQTIDQSLHSGVSSAYMPLVDKIVATVNPGFDKQIVARGTKQAKIGSFVLNADSDSLSVVEIDIQVQGSSYLQNLSLRAEDPYSGIPLGASIVSPVPGINSFSLVQTYAVPANTSRIVDLYSDIGASATGNVQTSVSHVQAIGVSDGNSTSIASPVSLQTITIQ